MGWLAMVTDLFARAVHFKSHCCQGVVLCGEKFGLEARKNGSEAWMQD